MRIKLQAASSTELPAYNPILPQSAITQVMLVLNPEQVFIVLFFLHECIVFVFLSLKDKVRLKFKLTYSISDKAFEENGQIDCLPLVVDLI